jgi:hypothetical protein
MQNLTNPWLQLPQSCPFALERDKAFLIQFNQKVAPNSRRFLHLDQILPEPFVGRLDSPVVLLSNNPGYIDEKSDWRTKPDLMAEMRENLEQTRADYPFLYLDPQFDRHSKWWRSKLRRLIEHSSQETVARSVVNITFFPYVSRNFAHRRLEIPSQQFTFKLVRDAIERGAVIVFMRRDDIWKEKVPALVGYKRAFQVSNTQNPAISPTNLSESQFGVIVDAIRFDSSKALTSG